MCRAAPSAHGSPSTENRRSRKNRGIARKSLHRSAGAPPFNVQHTRTDWEEDPAARAVRRPRATPLSLSQPFSPGRRRCSGAGPSPRSARTATGPLLRRDVHFALENDGWNCTFECEVHVSEPGGRPGRPPPWPVGPVRSPGCPLWSSPGLGRPFQRPVPATDRPVAPFPGVRSDAGCPNLPQRPGSSRSAREESLIFRAFLRGRSRPGPPLWQIWTRSRPGSPQESHQHHAAPVHPPYCADPGS